MNYDYVAIEREYGSRGTRIGELLSEKLGIPCYGKEILEDAAKRLKVSVSRIEQYEEKSTNSFLYSVYLMGKMDSSDNYLSREGNVFLEEQNSIRERALQGPAVFVGRCAVKALEDHGNVLKVFIHADRGFRKQNAIKEYGIAKAEADSVIAKFDKKRNHFYSVNTGSKWNDWCNYHLVLDSGKLGIAKCVEIIQAAMK